MRPLGEEENIMTKAQRVHKQAEKAMREAVAKVVRERRKSGQPVSIWKNGKVVTVSAKTIRLG